LSWLGHSSSAQQSSGEWGVGPLGEPQVLSKKDERVREGTNAMLEYEAEDRAVREKLHG